MKFHWLLSSFLGVFLFCSPARAGKILSWEFKTQNNDLVFITDEGVQPKAQLLNNPTRLVIDLPGTTLERETVKEEYQGAIRGFRIGQPEPEISRIVIEFAPGYTIDPQKVKFRGISSTQWTVDLPEPTIAPITSDIRSNSSPTDITPLPPVQPKAPLPTSNTAEASSSNVPGSDSSYVRATRNGFFIEIDGNRNDRITARKSEDGDRLDFDLEGVTLPSDLVSKSVAVNQYGVTEIEFTQVSTSPPQAQMSLMITPDSPDWLATFSRIKGLIVVPRGSLPPETPISINKKPNKNKVEESEDITLIDEIKLTDDDTRLVIRGDRDLSAVTTKPSTGIYEIRIDNTELSEDFEGPDLTADSPISQIKVRQDHSSVVISVTTRLRFRLGQISPEEQALAFPIQTGASLLPSQNEPLIPPQPIDVPKAETLRPIPRPIIPSNKTVVVIDPGHGGQDPGTIGIGGLQEKDLVLPISLDVAEILKQQGIEVRMTRDTDNFISLQGRTDFANNIDADLFVSIHANAINLSRPDINGLETYYYKNGRRLAEIIHWSILNGVNISNRGIRRARFYVLRHSIMPAVLVEVGFVTGAEDAPRLKNPTHRRQMAEAIARGIVQYIKQNQL